MLYGFAGRVRCGHGRADHAAVNKDGSVVGYVELAHIRREGGTTKAEVLVNLGRADRVDLDGLRRLDRSISRYLGERDADASPAPREVVDGGLSVVAARPSGAAWLLDGLWWRLGVAAMLREVLAPADTPPT